MRGIEALPTNIPEEPFFSEVAVSNPEHCSGNANPSERMKPD